MKYIAFCDVEDYRFENRAVAPAAADVVRYMADVFSETEDVTIVCPARSLNRSGFYKGRTEKIGEKVSLSLPSTFGANNSFVRLLSIIHNQTWLLCYLLKNVKVGEIVVVYHSLSYMPVIRLIKRIKKARIILEVREIYSDVKDSYSTLTRATNTQRSEEEKYFSIADAYIFPTQLLQKKINTESKPYIIATGLYKPVSFNVANKPIDSTIHAVFAGTLTPEKGAPDAIKAAEYLPGNYHVHILGYGMESEIAYIKKLIAENNYNNRAVVTYDGLLRGDEFTLFLRKCKIGLATQNVSSMYNDTSFPSKILTYLANDLEVVVGHIPAVEQSAVGNLVHYYENQTPESIAAAIRAIDFKDCRSKKEALCQLNDKLRNDFKAMIRGIGHD